MGGNGEWLSPLLLSVHSIMYVCPYCCWYDRYKTLHLGSGIKRTSEHWE